MKISGKEIEPFLLNDIPPQKIDELNQVYKGARGGTEIMYDGLMKRLPDDLKNKYQIICSRVREIDPKRKPILWLHDTWDDIENKHLADPDSRNRFKKLVFVSNYQFNTYNMGLGVPYDNSIVLRNAIEPIPFKEKSKDVCRLIYHTTPHRGLELLIPVYKKLYEIYGDKIHLTVFSSFQIYNWPEKDEAFDHILKECKTHPGITYGAYQPHSTVRECLRDCHIFAYPSIWPETSCLAALEALSGRCVVVAPAYAALPETCSNFAVTYPWSADVNAHVNVFAKCLYSVIENYFTDSTQKMINYQKGYIDTFYNWDLRIKQWEHMLRYDVK